MKKNIITISRQFGSGGRSIGKMLSERLGIPFYDKELIELASKESGIDERIFRSEGEETGRFYQVLGAIGFALGSPAGGIYEYSLNDELFLAQSSIIEQLAEKGPCILIGRCADYVLEDRDDLLNVFICADLKSRLARVIMWKTRMKACSRRWTSAAATIISTILSGYGAGRIIMICASIPESLRRRRSRR